MIVAKTKISSKNQVVLPQQVRQLLGVGSGDTVVWEIAGRKVEIVPQGKSWAQYTRCLGKKAWRNINTSSYIQTLRNEWQ